MGDARNGVGVSRRAVLGLPQQLMNLVAQGAQNDDLRVQGSNIRRNRLREPEGSLARRDFDAGMQHSVPTFERERQIIEIHSVLLGESRLSGNSQCIGLGIGCRRALRRAQESA